MDWLSYVVKSIAILARFEDMDIMHDKKTKESIKVCLKIPINIKFTSFMN